MRATLGIVAFAIVQMAKAVVREMRIPSAWRTPCLTGDYVSDSRRDGLPPELSSWVGFPSVLLASDQPPPLAVSP